MDSKYINQQKYLRRKYERFPLDLEVGKKEKFKELCKQNGTSAMAELRKFIDNYIEKNKKEAE